MRIEWKVLITEDDKRFIVPASFGDKDLLSDFGNILNGHDYVEAIDKGNSRLHRILFFDKYSCGWLLEYERGENKFSLACIESNDNFDSHVWDNMVCNIVTDHADNLIQCLTTNYEERIIVVSYFYKKE